MLTLQKNDSRVCKNSGSVVRRGFLVPFVLLVFCVRVPLAAERSQPVVPVDGEPFAAQVVAIDAQWNITFQRAGDAQVLAARDLVYWGAYRDAYRGTQILLVDGSLLCAEVLEIGQETLVSEGPL